MLVTEDERLNIRCPLKPTIHIPYTLKNFFTQVVTEDERLNIRSINDLVGGGELAVVR